MPPAAVQEICVGIALRSSLDREAYAERLACEPGFAVRRGGAGPLDDEGRASTDVWLSDRCLQGVVGDAPVLILPDRSGEPVRCGCCSPASEHRGWKGLTTELARAVGLPKPPPQPELECLSRRELDVLRLVGRGKSVPQTAETLGVSPSTVGNHKHRMMRKLGVSTSLELLRIAVRHGLAPIDTPEEG